jgi:hypothetical protein
MRGYAIAVIFGIAAVALLVGYVLLNSSQDGLPENDQEIAWIYPATSGVTWDQFVRGVRRYEEGAEGQAAGLRVDYRRAYPEQTSATPELVLSRSGSNDRLHIRWYKLTSETDVAYWVRRFSESRKPPLAVLGGSTSDRARDLAVALQKAREASGRPTPLLLITTATADRVHLLDEADEGPELNRIYPDRTFRFCFTNSQMAEALVSFVVFQEALRPHGPLSAIVGAPGAASTSPLGGASLLACGLTAPVFSIEWNDDPYSLDLAEHLRHEVRRHLLSSLENRRIPYSTGDVLRPNGPEQAAVWELVEEWSRLPGQRKLLLLPAADRPMRRVLRSLAVVAPENSRQAVVVTGDSLNLDIVFRDRDILWPIQELPFTLVFFAHENPVAWPPAQPAGEGKSPDAPRNRGSTHDLLLNAQIMRRMTEAAWQMQDGRLRLVDSPVELAEGLRHRAPAFFDETGNRLQTSGAYVVLVQPRFDGPRVLPEAVLSVWRGRVESADGNRHWLWANIKQWSVSYGQTSADF